MNAALVVLFAATAIFPAFAWQVGNNCAAAAAQKSSVSGIESLIDVGSSLCTSYHVDASPARRRVLLEPG